MQCVINQGFTLTRIVLKFGVIEFAMAGQLLLTRRVNNS